MYCRFLLQGIFLTQGSNLSPLHLLDWQADSLPLHYLGSPYQQWINTRLRSPFRKPKLGLRLQEWE